MGIFKKQPKAGVAEAYIELRASALDAGPTVGPPPADHPDVLGVLVDIPHGEAFATVVALADGTTSMYTSSGGGVIGGGQHIEIVQAARTVLRAVQANLVLFPADRDRGLPPVGFVRFTVIGPGGQRIAHVPEAAFWGQEPSPVADLIDPVQALISRLRELSPPT